MELIKINSNNRPYYSDDFINGFECGAKRQFETDKKARLQGEWVDGHRMKMGGCYYWFRECSECGYERDDDDTDKDTNFCPNCGARMKGADDDYERAVEQMEHDMLYEPTYNSEDGSM